MAELSEFTDSGRACRAVLQAAKPACLGAGDAEILPTHLLQACAATQAALVTRTFVAMGLAQSQADSLQKAVALAPGSTSGTEKRNCLPPRSGSSNRPRTWRPCIPMAANR